MRCKVNLEVLNVVTAIITEKPGVLTRLHNANLAGDTVTLNAFVYFELKRGLVLPRFRRKLADFERLVRRYGVLPLSMGVLDEAARIYQTLRAAGTPLEDADADILIAATATYHEAVLVTRNIRHFERVPDLKLENWEEG